MDVCFWLTRVCLKRAYGLLFDIINWEGLINCFGGYTLLIAHSLGKIAKAHNACCHSNERVTMKIRNTVTFVNTS